jgi:pilus assembly protein Flp/PilA
MQEGGNIMRDVKNFLMDEDGQGMVEYGLIIGLVALAVIGALAVLGPKISDMFQNASDQLTTTARP